ncbi:hypothetical protein V8F20_001869 [Naviculisporaceae sp. PSN 640]
MLLDSFESCSTYQELQAIRNAAQTQILAAFDLENIDHPCNAHTPVEKLSEIGIAVIDMGKLNKPIADASFEELVDFIQARHTIIQQWAWVTPRTCPSTEKWHANKDRDHVANPYTCQFANSKISSGGRESMYQAIYFLNSMSNWRRGPGHPERTVNIMCWAAALERATINEVNGNGFSSPTTYFKDLQKFSPVYRRWYNMTGGRQTQPSCRDFLHSLGLGSLSGGAGVCLHNACNDAVMELAAFLRILKFTEAEWDSWMAGEDLPPVTVKTQQKNAFSNNQALEKKMTARRRHYF